jgi:hypothetical protein
MFILILSPYFLNFSRFQGRSLAKFLCLFSQTFELHSQPSVISLQTLIMPLQMPNKDFRDILHVFHPLYALIKQTRIFSDSPHQKETFFLNLSSSNVPISPDWAPALAFPHANLFVRNRRVCRYLNTLTLLTSFLKMESAYIF